MTMPREQSGDPRRCAPGSDALAAPESGFGHTVREPSRRSNRPYAESRGDPERPFSHSAGHLHPRLPGRRRRPARRAISAIPTVPGSDVLTVSDAITWPAASIPESGHYCFVGLVGNEQDPAPNPTDFNDFDTYRLYIRNNNNVTWRNFNVESNEPNEGDFRAMKFLAPGANARTRRFCLEVLAKLPRGSRLQVEAPLALLQAMQAASPWTIVDGDRGRVPINPHGTPPRLCVLPPEARLPASAARPRP